MDKRIEYPVVMSHTIARKGAPVQNTYDKEYAACNKNRGHFNCKIFTSSKNSIFTI